MVEFATFAEEQGTSRPWLDDNLDQSDEIVFGKLGPDHEQTVEPLANEVLPEAFDCTPEAFDPRPKPSTDFVLDRLRC